MPALSAAIQSRSKEISMNKDASTLWGIIDRAETREAVGFEREVTASGANVMEFVAEPFYEWAMAANPEEVGLAILQIAR
jgi:hypothetical protein